MSVNKEDIKKLRQMTGVGIGDCKKALEKANGDFDKALEILKQKGLAKAIKKAGRETTEGKVFSYNKDNKAVIVEIECETDFVANTKDFREFGKIIAEKVWNLDLDNLDNLPEDIENLKNQTVLKLNENIKISRMIKLRGDNLHPVVDFIQMGKDGALMKFKLDKEIEINEELKEILEDIAVTASFYKPKYKTIDDIPSDVMEKEKENILQQLKNDEKFKNKPENVLQNIVNGKVRKAFIEECLYELPFYKEESKTIQKILEETSNKFGVNIEVEEYKFLKIGL